MANRERFFSHRGGGPPRRRRPTAKMWISNGLPDLLPPEEGRSSTRGISADLSSMFADDAPHPRPGDHVVLLTSDSEVGVRCAAVVGAILHAYLGGVNQRVDVGGTVALPGLRCGVDSGRRGRFQRLAGALAGAGVTVAVVGGLTADEEFAVALSRLGHRPNPRLGLRCGTCRQSSTRLHPIGGYKATIPQFTALASHLPTGHEVDVEMWSNHETAPIGLRQPLLRIGVPDAEYWDLQELTQSQTVDADEASGRSSGPAAMVRWDDYAWDHSGGDDAYQLTDVGRSIVELRAACRREPGSPRGT